MIDEMKAGFENSVVMREIDGVYYLHDSVLGVVAQGIDLEAAYAELTAEKSRVIAHYKDAGFEHDLPTGPPAMQGRGLARETLPFLIKTTIVSCIAAGFIIWAASPVTNAVHTLTQRSQNALKSTRAQLEELTTPSVAGRKAIDVTSALASAIQQLTPERKAQLRENLRIIVREIKPLAAELHPLFVEPEAQP